MEALSKRISDEASTRSTWPQIRLALYGGGWLTNLETDGPPDKETNEFLSHVTRIVRQLEMLGVPIKTIRSTPPYQVSVRFHEGIHSEQMWFVIADALRQAGLDLSRVQRSVALRGHPRRGCQQIQAN